MESFELDQQAVLVKNDKYFLGEPNLDKVIFKVITDQNQEANALRTGEVDIALQLTGETVKIVAEDETGIEDDTHKTVLVTLPQNEETLEEPIVEKHQLELVEDKNARIYRMGYTLEQVEEMIEVLAA